MPCSFEIIFRLALSYESFTASSLRQLFDSDSLLTSSNFCISDVNPSHCECLLHFWRYSFFCLLPTYLRLVAAFCQRNMTDTFQMHARHSSASFWSLSFRCCGRSALPCVNNSSSKFRSWCLSSVRFWVVFLPCRQHVMFAVLCSTHCLDVLLWDNSSRHHLKRRHLDGRRVVDQVFLQKPCGDSSVL